MNVITLEEEAFYQLVAKTVTEIQKRFGAKQRDKWIDGEEAMRQLRITSKTTLQKLRDTGAIRYSQPMPKVILYDSDSIDAYIEKHVREPF
ncbi:helix-turn-helix domain-containing protein [Rufibacter sediminis]|uniref:Helix-turn-helix domain-containing protein n=1 Tax=Rufibacter sediminis TaxID=2762756 RepID=A0ABR6VTY6_9BACT|nr:helix-turn-helix domain-containing protein [Rufibacter sediminis]MBC3540677.1 helix-turn-helix domain-containing protein [Rufibacter sediminis]